MKNIKKLLIFLIVITIILAIAVIFIDKNRQDVSIETEKIKVVASFYPIAEFTKQVGGENVRVINIVPPGTKAHDFEPTSQDIIQIYSAQIFIYHGSGFDPWAKKIALELKKRGVYVINMTEHFDLLKGTKDKHKDDYEKDKYKEEEFDPHIWLDPVLAKRKIEIIRDALKKVDNENAQEYINNAENYLMILSQLHERFEKGLASCAIRYAVASHAAFNYLGKRYNINFINIAGLSPKEEPSPKRMAEITELAREKNIRYIFFETLVSPKLAETIAREIGIETLVLNPVEGLTNEELAAGKNYILIMKENLVNLRRALQCQ